MRRAIITGSFDPVTSGHADLISRSAEIFDEVWAVILTNGKKSGMFTPEERLELLNAAVSSLPQRDRIKTAVHIGLTSDFAHRVGADFIVRGARNASDFDYEYNLSLIMKRFDEKFETIIIPSRPELSAVSSTYVRELLKYGCELGDAVPSSCRELMSEMYSRKLPHGD